MTGWTAVVTALSVAIIAVAIVAFSIALLALMRQMTHATKSLDRLLDAVDRDARPALEAVRRTADETSRVAILVKGEAEGIVETSKSLRARVERTASTLEDRFVEFETLVDLLQDEVEDTVLDVAAALRTARRGSGLVRRIRRAFRRR